MGCNNGKCSRKMKSKESTMASDPTQDSIVNLKKEIKILRSCYFKVAKANLIEMTTLRDDIKFVQQNTQNTNIQQIEELSTCYRLNITQRGSQLQMLILPQIQKTKLEQMIGSNTSLGCQTSERQLNIEESTLTILRYCEVFSENDQENIEDSASICTQQQQQFQQQRDIPYEIAA